MIYLKVLIVLIVLIILLMLLPVGIDAGYDGRQAFVGTRIGPKVFWLYPWKSHRFVHKTKKREKTKQEALSSLSKPKKAVKLNINWEEIKAGLDLLVRSVKKLRFRLHHLTLHVVSAFPDPYDTVMAYGCMTAAVNVMGLERLKQADIQLGVDFSADKSEFNGDFSVTIRIYYVLKFGLTMAFGALRLLLAHRKRLKQEQTASALIAGKEG